MRHLIAYHKISNDNHMLALGSKKLLKNIVYMKVTFNI